MRDIEDILEALKEDLIVEESFNPEKGCITLLEKETGVLLFLWLNCIVISQSRGEIVEKVLFELGNDIEEIENGQEEITIWKRV